mgnify:FL=1
MGVDVGSTASKCVVLKNGETVVASAVIPVGTGTTGPARAMAQALENAGATIDDISCVFATGYGRNSLPEADSEMSELSCHAKGAHFLFPAVRTVIDIGGQDSKALQIAPNGRLLNFAMNDKCAAGTGRFLDVMARVLEVNVEDLGRLSAESTERINISSTCTVFAESEVISHLAANTKTSDIIAGIHRSVASRSAGLAKRVGVTPMVVMTGGVALNSGVVAALEEELDCPIAISSESQFAGAIGAALYGYESVVQAAETG